VSSNAAKTQMKIIAGAPLALRLARAMSRSQMRGAGVLMRLLNKLGVLNRIAQYEVGHAKFSVPLFRIPWDFCDVTNYERKFVELFCRALIPFQNALLFDCGADIGTFSSLVCSCSKNIARIIAFEPNPEVREFLRSNLSNLPITHQLIPKAISDFEGVGKLQRPEDNLTDHARFLIPGDGPIEVTTIDSMNVRGGYIAIKLDIEGGELDALKGATETIAAAQECVIAVEAHPSVARRIGRSDRSSIIRSSRSGRRSVTDEPFAPSAAAWTRPSPARSLRGRSATVWSVSL